MTKDEMVEGFVEIEPLDRANFLKVRETLTRIGIPSSSSETPTLLQVCYVLHKRGRYFIVTGTELHRLDGKEIALTEGDSAYRDAVVDLLEQWTGLGVRVVSHRSPSSEPPSKLKVIHHSEKDGWNLIPNYHIGTKKPR